MGVAMAAAATVIPLCFMNDLRLNSGIGVASSTCPQARSSRGLPTLAEQISPPTTDPRGPSAQARDRVLCGVYGAAAGPDD
jgi:hypothetical protein